MTDNTVSVLPVLGTRAEETIELSLGTGPLLRKVHLGDLTVAVLKQSEELPLVTRQLVIDELLGSTQPILGDAVAEKSASPVTLDVFRDVDGTAKLGEDGPHVSLLTVLFSLSLEVLNDSSLSELIDSVPDVRRANMSLVSEDAAEPVD